MEVGDSTEVAFRQGPFKTEARRALHRDGWTDTFDKLEGVLLVERAVAAVNARDLGAYLACCTEDIELRTPLASIEGVHRGADGIKRFFADIVDTGPDFKVTIDHLEAVAPARVLGFLRINVSGRASGIQLGSDLPTTNIYDIAGGKIKRIRIFLDRDEALLAARVEGEG
jgi:hypothetical protein